MVVINSLTDRNLDRYSFIACVPLGFNLHINCLLSSFPEFLIFLGSLWYLCLAQIRHQGSVLSDRLKSTGQVLFQFFLTCEPSTVVYITRTLRKHTKILKTFLATSIDSNARHYSHIEQNTQLFGPSIASLILLMILSLHTNLSNTSIIWHHFRIDFNFTSLYLAHPT